MNNYLICQSCGMPLNSDQDFGANKDGSKNAEYCCHCYQNGEFTFKGDADEFIAHQVEIAKQKLGMLEDQAKQMASGTIPNLKRWKEGEDKK